MNLKKNIERAKLLDWIVPIVSKSHIAARKWVTPLSFVFIDGSHSFESAKRDYISWSPHIMPGGFLAIHDVFFLIHLKVETLPGVYMKWPWHQGFLKNTVL